MRLDNVFMGVISEALSKAKYVVFHTNGREMNCDLIIDKGHYYALGVKFKPQVRQRYKLPNSFYKNKPFFGAVEEESDDSVEFVQKYEPILTVNKENVLKIEKNNVVKVEFKENKINYRETTDQDDEMEDVRRFVLWRGEISEQQALASKKLAEVAIDSHSIVDYENMVPGLSITNIIAFLRSKGIEANE